MLGFLVFSENPTSVVTLWKLLRVYNSFTIRVTVAKIAARVNPRAEGGDSVTSGWWVGKTQTPPLLPPSRRNPQILQHAKA